MTVNPGAAGPTPERPDPSLSLLLAQHRGRLRRLVAVRLDPRLYGRLDPSDVIQEAYLEAAARYGDYQRNPPVPLFLWLRYLTLQKLAGVPRQHLAVQVRGARREV